MYQLLCLLLACAAPAPVDPFDQGESIALDKAIPGNERGILCLAKGKDGRIYGGTTGRAAHLFVYDPARAEVHSLARLDGGVGFAYGLIALPDGTLIGGTQADPTGIALATDPAKVGHLYKFTLAGTACKIEDLGVAVAGQGIYTLAFAPSTNTILGNTWPDGHFFIFDLKTKTFKDHGAIAGYRTFEQPQHAEDINRGSKEPPIRYARQVSRAIVVHDDVAFTGGAEGFLYRYECKTGKLAKSDLRLPAARGRESWASLDAAIRFDHPNQEAILGGTSDGYVFQLITPARPGARLFCIGKPLRQGRIEGFGVVGPASGDSFIGMGGEGMGVPRSFRRDIDRGLSTGGIPHVEGQPELNGFGAILDAGSGTVYAGERDRIARLVRFGGKPNDRKVPPPAGKIAKAPTALGDNPPRLDFRVVFAPAGTTTDGSGYTAIEFGKDDRVYAGAARYGSYGSLLRFDPRAKPVFMDKVVTMRELTGEDRSGINTQGKIHAKILVGADGKIWFGSKQAHEIFDTRPEYGEDPDGYPGGHLCYYDPKTGFSRSLGILMKQEGLMAGAIDDARGRIYFRSEPKNHFLVYDLKTGKTQDRGNVGAFCRYMAMDKNGVVYTVGRTPYLCRYDPATGYVEDLLIKVEGEGGYAPPYVIAIGPNGKLYGVVAGHASIMEFDIDKINNGAFPEVTMRNAAPAAPPGFPVDDIHAAIFGKDGRFYWPLNTTGPIEAGGKPEIHLRLMRFDPITRKTETVGVPRVVDFDEAKVKHTYVRGEAKFNLRYMQGAAVAEDGSLYLLGIYPQLHVACFPKLTAPK